MLAEAKLNFVDVYSSLFECLRSLNSVRGGNSEKQGVSHEELDIGVPMSGGLPCLSWARVTSVLRH